MSSLILSGDTSGTVALAAPAVAGLNTMTLVAGTGSLAPKVLSTAVASTSGTAIDFTNIPSWATRVTVMFNGVSKSGTSANFLFRLGSGSVQTTGYVGQGGNVYNSAAGVITSTVGIPLIGNTTSVFSGAIRFSLISDTTWVAEGSFGSTPGSAGSYVATSTGTVTLSGALDRVRVTQTASETFTAGFINIMYE